MTLTLNFRLREAPKNPPGSLPLLVDLAVEIESGGSERVVQTESSGGAGDRTRVLNRKNACLYKLSDRLIVGAPVALSPARSP